MFARGSYAGHLSAPRLHSLGNLAFEIGDFLEGKLGDRGLGVFLDFLVHVIANRAVIQLFLDEDGLVIGRGVRFALERRRHVILRG